MVINNSPSITSNFKVNSQVKNKKETSVSDEVLLGQNTTDNTIAMADKLKNTKSLGGAVVGILDIRVPTTTPNITEERRQKILDTVRPGDIILETNNAYPNWQRLEMATLGSSYTHAAIYEGDGKFLEATTSDTGGGVMRSDLKEYLEEGPIMIEVIRPPYKNPEDVNKALDYCRSQLGKPYDAKFDFDDDSAICCIELVNNAMKEVNIDIPTKKLFGKTAVGPDACEDIEGAEIVYSDGSSFWKNQASHWPVALGAGVTAMAAGSVLGPLGAVAGFFGGLALSICVGNKIQTGHFNLWGIDTSNVKKA